MNDNHTRARSRRAGRAVVALAVIAGLALLVPTARQITAHLVSANPAGTPAPPAVASPSAHATGLPGAPDTSATPAPASPPPPAGGADETPGIITIGEVIMDETFMHTAQPDRVTIGTAAATTARVAPWLPGQDSQAPGTGDDPAGEDLESVGDAAGSTADQPIDASVQPLEVRVETVGHFAILQVGVGGDLAGTLATLSIDFGDGTVLALSDRQITKLAASGRMEVVHEYEPTLTPQPQEVLVTASNRDGKTHDRTVQFGTRAEYRLTYSPLVVTALDDCDLVGKGDFELTWQLDSRPARTSSFALGKGETHVEERFRVGVTGVHYDRPVEFFLVRIEEHDSGPGGFTPLGFREFPLDNPVVELGHHHYDVTMRADDVENAGPAGSSLHWDCDVEMTFTAYLSMIDSPDRR